MKTLLTVALGILTSIGGFLDAGSIATSAQAGAAYGYALLWPILLGSVLVIFLVEMSGRFAAVSRHTITHALRERFGFPFFLVPFLAGVLINLLTLAAEIGGACISLQLATGIAFQLWALPVAFAAWLFLWRGNFDLVENGAAILGLVTLVFVAAPLTMRPDWHALAAGLIPSMPAGGKASYGFLVVSMLGATISPYLFYFYSAGVMEDELDERYLRANRVAAGAGMLFGTLVSMGVLVTAALVLHPRHIQIDQYEQAALALVPAFGSWGFYLFAASLGIACFGAALELSLVCAYSFAQGFGWNWGENLKPRRAARFSFTYTVFILAAALLMVAGVDPLELTLLSMALTAVILPLTIMPFLILMNDERYMGRYRNGFVSNAVVIVTTVLAFVIALVAIPLELLGGA